MLQCRDVGRLPESVVYHLISNIVVLFTATATDVVGSWSMLELRLMLVLLSGAGACSDLVDSICCSLLSSSQSEAGGECRNSDMRNHKYCIVVSHCTTTNEWSNSNRAMLF